MKTRFFLVSMLFLFVTALQAQNNNEGNKSGNRQDRPQREFPSKEMIKEYSLSNDQVTKLKKVSTDFTKKREELRKGSKDAKPSDETMKKMKSLMDEQNKAIKEVLNKEQQAKWDKQQAERAEKMKNARKGNNRQRGDRPNNGERGSRSARPSVPTGAPSNGLW